MSEVATARPVMLPQHPIGAVKLRKLARKVRMRLVPDCRFSREGYAFAPVDITLQLTFACNVRCSMCYQEVLRDGHEHREDFVPSTYPSIRDYQRFLDDASGFLPNIRLTGGEPFLYPQLMDLAACAKGLGLNLTIPTNGTYLSRFARAIVDTPVDVLIVSFNGPEEIHDRIVRAPGSFREAIEGLRAILALRRDDRHPRVVMNVACANDNQRHMPEMIRLAEDTKVDAISFTHLWYWDQESTAAQFAQYPQFGQLQPTGVDALGGIDAQAMVDGIAEIRRGGYKVPVSFYPDLDGGDIVKYYSRPKEEMEGRACLVPWLATYVRPNGDVAPSYLDYTVGNIKDKTFWEIWNGEPMRALRRVLREKRQMPACRRCTGIFLFRGPGCRLSGPLTPRFSESLTPRSRDAVGQSVVNVR